MEKSAYCKQHDTDEKRERHGCVIGGIAPKVQQLFNDFARRVRKASGYEWYSRMKLWDEAQLIDKTPADLTDEEFMRALYNINRFSLKNKAVVLSWQLEPYKGPQSVDDRNDLERLNYLGTPMR